MLDWICCVDLGDREFKMIYLSVQLVFTLKFHLYVLIHYVILKLKKQNNKSIILINDHKSSKNKVECERKSSCVCKIVKVQKWS